MKLPIPLKPMEPKKIEKPFNSLDHIFQVKWDGVRCLAYSYQKKFQLFNRKLNEKKHAKLQEKQLLG